VVDDALQSMLENLRKKAGVETVKDRPGQDVKVGIEAD
jgi:hypothetical protein